MAGLTTADRDKVKAAVGELTELKHLMESEVAAALGVHIGFSDADGD
jgi:predicted lipoprotein